MKQIAQRSRPAPRFALGAALTGAALLLASCGGTMAGPGTEDTQPIILPGEQLGRIPGQITPFTVGQAASVKPEELNESAPVSATGSFDLGLPTVTSMTAKYSDLLFNATDVFGACSNVTTTAPDSLRLYPIATLKTDTGQPLTANASGSTTAKNWWFASQDASYTFQGECIGLGTVNATFNLKLGWNVLDVNYGGTVTSYTQVDAPTAPVEWRTGGLGSQRLNNALEPWKNSAAYRARQ
ncbi:hypothetical protein [Deinococcus sp. Leaf326]|uniref:hypothetical protein n=1 Tax=Deinococcus sp. Leaf326 TaxID=1736338 RepID=UPI000701CF0C|nr:hypothetical protein [Deinococcus sp. Leaf326]KQR41196.1 hypothetical protein ASF71_03550 [Deinococcus sp. Leaf326]